MSQEPIHVDGGDRDLLRAVGLNVRVEATPPFGVKNKNVLPVSSLADLASMGGDTSVDSFLSERYRGDFRRFAVDMLKLEEAGLVSTYRGFQSGPAAKVAITVRGVRVLDALDRVKRAGWSSRRGRVPNDAVQLDASDLSLFTNLPTRGRASDAETLALEAVQRGEGYSNEARTRASQDRALAKLILAGVVEATGSRSQAPRFSTVPEARIYVTSELLKKPIQVGSPPSTSARVLAWFAKEPGARSAEHAAKALGLPAQKAENAVKALIRVGALKPTGTEYQGRRYYDCQVSWNMTLHARQASAPPRTL